MNSELLTTEGDSTSHPSFTIGEKIIIPAGNYIVSDACYVLPSDDVREDMKFYKSAMGTDQYGDANYTSIDNTPVDITHIDGFITGYCFNTAYGDCCVTTELGDLFCDAGNISLFEVGAISSGLREDLYIPFTLSAPGNLIWHNVGDWEVENVIRVNTR